MKTKQILPVLIFSILVMVVAGCKKTEEDPPVTPPTATNVFKCSIGTATYKAVSLVTEGNYYSAQMIPVSKGLKTSNGTTPLTGDTLITLLMGCNTTAEFSTGAHSIAEAMQNNADNRGKAVFKVIINGMNYYPVVGEGTVSVEKYYYQTTTDWRGAKGTFNNIRLLGNDGISSFVLTNGVFDLNYQY
ncbi:MAG: hypothetical protein ACOYNC_11075 [Bacteroidales bacterium]